MLERTRKVVFRIQQALTISENGFRKNGELTTGGSYLHRYTNGVRSKYFFELKRMAQQKLDQVRDFS